MNDKIQVPAAAAVYAAEEARPPRAPFTMTYEADGAITFSGTLPSRRAAKTIQGLPLDAESLETLIDAAIAAIKHLPSTREISLAKTKLQEARFWAEEAKAVTHAG